MTERLLRIEEVEHLVGLRRSAIYAAIAAGTFPRPIKISERAVAWVKSDVQKWISDRIAEQREHNEEAR
jgi:prophage regulatory protein